MKKQTKFILRYSLSFFLLSTMCVVLFDKSRSMEMFAYVLWGNIIYFPLSILGWMGVNLIADQITNIKYQQIIRFGLGLATILIFMQIAKGGDSAFVIIVAILCIYIISFLIASTAYVKSNKGLAQKEENTMIK